MSTEYIHHYDRCACCGRFSECTIGTSALGWTFTFRERAGVETAQEWRRVLREGEIWDEYGRQVAYGDFWQMVDDRQATGKNNHARMYPDSAYLDPEGYAFVRLI